MPLETTQSSDSKPNLSSWLPVICLSFGAFVFNTSEFIPIPLLSAIASDFAMSEAHTGLMITAYAWIVALVSLPLMLLFSKSELKRLMLCVMGLFVASHIISALAQSFLMLMASRVGVAFSHALFWSIASPMAIRAAPKGKQSLAISFIVTGSSLAMIAGLPLGRMLGLYMNWRSTFMCIGGLSGLMLLLFWRVFPVMQSAQNISLKTLPTLLENKKFKKICLLTLILTTGHFSAYSYIEPFLAQYALLGEHHITRILVLFGCSGVVASVIFSKYYDKRHFVFVNLCLCGVGVSLFLLHLGGVSLMSAVILCAFWGLCLMLFNLIFQSQTIAAIPQATMIAMSIYSGIYNVGIGGGALIGAISYEHIGVWAVGYVGGGFALLAYLYFIFKMPFARVFHRFVYRRKAKKSV